MGANFDNNCEEHKLKACLLASACLLVYASVVKKKRDGETAKQLSLDHGPNSVAAYFDSSGKLIGFCDGIELSPPLLEHLHRLLVDVILPAPAREREE